MAFYISEECKKTLELAQKIICREKAMGNYIQDEPGTAALQMYPQLLSELSKGVYSIVVTGTNGKTTTTRLICSILKEAGIEFFTNREGANMSGRIATLFAENFHLENGPIRKLAVLECDEGYLKLVIPEINPSILVITNIYPDQKERFGSEENVSRLICEAMEKTKPGICLIASDCHYKEHIQSLSGWKHMQFTRDNEAISIYNHLYVPKMKIPGAFNVWNASAAAGCCEVLNIPAESILKGIENTLPAFGRMEEFWCNGHKVIITLVKNTAGFSVISEYIQTGKSKNSPFSSRKDTWIIAINRNDGDDLDTEWLWENVYSGVSKCFNRILVSGNCVGILMQIMKRDQIGVIPIAMEDIPLYTKETDGVTVITANYSVMMELRKKYSEDNMVCPYWED